MYLCIKSLFKQDLVQQTPGCQNNIRVWNKITDKFSQPCLRLSPLYQIINEYRKKVTKDPGFLYLNHFISIISWLWIRPLSFSYLNSAVVFTGLLLRGPTGWAASDSKLSRGRRLQRLRGRRALREAAPYLRRSGRQLRPPWLQALVQVFTS